MLHVSTHTHALNQRNDLFSVSCSSFTKHSVLTFFAQPQYIATKCFPDIIEFLQQHLPSIFLSECFNDYELPFIIEVTHTETGHLYEHILLEYLVTLGPENHFDRVYEGLTSWNWNQLPFGMFHIKVNVGKNDRPLLDKAIRYSNYLLEELIHKHSSHRFSVP